MAFCPPSSSSVGPSCRPAPPLLERASWVAASDDLPLATSLSTDVGHRGSCTPRVNRASQRVAWPGVAGCALGGGGTSIAAVMREASVSVAATLSPPLGILCATTGPSSTSSKSTASQRNTDGAGQLAVAQRKSSAAAAGARENDVLSTPSATAPPAGR